MNRISSDLSLPKISVVTITYNRREDLKETFNSVINQTFKEFEYIVVDGGSSDDTTSFLQEKSSSISRWVSEPDRGIYDAMNKGAKLANGEWLIFMNAGDQFFSNETLAQVSNYLNDSVDVIYGGVESVYTDRYQTRVFQSKPHSLLELWHEIQACHQSIFVRRDLQIHFTFDISYSWCADHDLMVRLYGSGYRFQEIPVVISRFDASEGETNRDILIHVKERWRLSQKLASPLRRHSYFVREYVNFWIWKTLITRIRDTLPKQLVVALRKYRGTT